MGNLRSRPAIVLKDCATNTDIPYLFLTSAASDEIRSLQEKIETIESRLQKAENETKSALEQLREHDSRSFEIITAYKQLSVDITLQKESIIEELNREVLKLKQEKGMKYSKKSKSVCW